MVAQARIELATQGFSVLCSTDWATEPMAVSTGLEPAISSVTDWHVNHYTMRPFGCGGRIWTYDLRVMSPTSYQLLYSAILYFFHLWFANGGGSRIWTRARLTACRFSRPIPSAGLGYSSVKWKLVDPVGLEPTTDRLWAGSSNQLSYGSKMVAVGGFEPSTSRVWTVRSSQLSYTAS